MITIENNSMACNRFFELVSDFCSKVKPWETYISYETKPDEKGDLTLVSQRVYGRRDEFLVIIASAGLSTVDEPLNEQLLKLPTEEQLAILKEKANYTNNVNKRNFL